MTITKKPRPLLPKSEAVNVTDPQLQALITAELKAKGVDEAVFNSLNGVAFKQIDPSKLSQYVKTSGTKVSNYFLVDAVNGIAGYSNQLEGTVLNTKVFVDKQGNRSSGNVIAKPEITDDSTVQLPEGYVWATDADFYDVGNGDFRYIGTAEYVAIPHVIEGVPVTSYNSMFQFSSVKGVYSDNPNVTDMSRMFNDSKATTLDVSHLNTSSVTDMTRMFYSSRATTLDLSSFDTSNVTKMSNMFSLSKATTGYARTTADANKFNISDGKPTGLTFVVKP